MLAPGFWSNHQLVQILLDQSGFFEQKRMSTVMLCLLLALHLFTSLWLYQHAMTWKWTRLTSKGHTFTVNSPLRKSFTCTSLLDMHLKNIHNMYASWLRLVWPQAEQTLLVPASPSHSHEQAWLCSMRC